MDQEDHLRLTRAREQDAMNQWRFETAGSEAANYSITECDAIVRRLHSPERKRVVAICADCYTHVGDDHILPAPVGEMRMCDIVADPLWCSARPSGPAIAHERFEGASAPGSASEGACARVLGHGTVGVRWSHLDDVDDGCR